MPVRSLLLSAAALCFATLLFLQQGYSIRRDSGSLDVIPRVSTAGSAVSLTATYTVGSEGVKKGGSVKLQFPNSWHQNPWLFKTKPPKYKSEQTERSDDWHYVGATTGNASVRLKTSISNWGLDNQDDRFGRVFIATVEDGELREGDRVTYEYKKTTAPATREVNIIQIGVDSDGDGSYELRPASVEVDVLPGVKKAAMLILPSRAQVNTPVEFAVVVLDRFANAAEDFSGRFSFTTTDPAAVVPEPYDFNPSDKGWKTFTITFQTPGVHYITGTDNQYLASTGLLSNPIEITEQKPDYFIYWGDVHSHCEHSLDGTGRAETAFWYAQDVSRLDFYGLTDHCDGSQTRHDREEGKTPWEWEENKYLVHKYHQPGSFVTFTAYEWSAPAPYGHNNVFHTDPDAEIIYMSDVKHLPDLWKKLEGQDVFTLPHHTGIAFGGNRPGFKADLEELIANEGRSALKMQGPVVDWRYRHPLRTSVEIYSLHGSSEFYGAPNKYEDVDNVLAASNPGPHYARDAWAMGQIIGTMSGSDDHMAHPGMIHGGLSAVLATELTREAIHRAVTQRHTYGTTGHRIYLNFTINGHLMGDMIEIEDDDVPEIAVKVAAMDKIGLIEVMKFDGFAWSPVYRSTPFTREIDVRFTDHGFESSSLYYVRVVQEREYENVLEYRGRWVLAWSSPVWVTRSDSPWWASEKIHGESNLNPYR